MMTKIFLFISVFVVSYVVCEEELVHPEDFSNYFDTIILPRDETSTQFDKESWLWEEYEFESGFINREELKISDVQIRQDLDLQANITNWQYVNHNYEPYIAGTENSTLFLYHFDYENGRVTSYANLTVAERIKSFRVMSFSVNDEKSTEIKDSMIVILSVENSNNIQYLKWFYLQNHNFHSFWIWELLKTVKSLTYFNMDDKHKFIVLYDKDVYFSHSYSLIEVYDIKIDGQFSRQLSCQFLVSEISDIRVCPSREGRNTFALMDRDYVTLHEYKDILSTCVLKSIKNITVSNLNSVVCFESSNINHLAASGFVTNFFKFHSEEFVYQKEMENLLDGVGDVHFITDFPVDTYRNDVVLFIQSKNLTVFALCWKNEKFQFVHLPNSKLNGIDLSKAVAIPNYGFFNSNSIVKLKVKLVPLQKSGRSGMEAMLRIKSILENTMNTQELKISKIELESQSIYPNNLQIENLNSTAVIDVNSLLLKENNNCIISTEYSNFTLGQLQTNYDESRSLLHEMGVEISQIENQIDNMLTVSASDTLLLEEIDLDGNFEIRGTAIVKNLFTNYLNDVNVDILFNNCLSPVNKIIGNKTFPSIKFEEGSLKIKNLNGVPIENYQFEEDNSHLPGIDLSKIKKLEVKENLNISIINDINWNMLIDQLVFRNKKKVIPGRTTFLGVMNTTFTQTDYLNDFKYPLEYVAKSGPENGEVTGVKTFKTLTVSDLNDVKTINDTDADEFIILTADQTLKQKIIFENLVIEENLQIDGKIVGPPEQYVNPDLTLLNSNIVQSNVMFRKLNISGKIYVDNLIDGIEWSEIDDLILKDDESVIVTGTKIFTNSVQIHGDLEIKDSIINEHPINSFITLDTRQILPNLSKMTGNIKFTGVTYEAVENIEDKLKTNIDDMEVPKCSIKRFVFLKAPIVDEFSSEFLNDNITGKDFAEKIYILLNEMHFINMKCKKLIVLKLNPGNVNGINVNDFEDKKITRNSYQKLSGLIEINNFETTNLFTKSINNRSYEQLQDILKHINNFYQEVVNNDRHIYSLHTDKFIITPKINNKNLQNHLDFDEITQFLLRTNGSIGHLIVKGLVNNVDLSNKFSDCVLKNDKVIIISGPKKISRFITHNLKVDYINGHAVQDIITGSQNQTLFGPLFIKGFVNVIGTFHSHGKINDIKYEKLHVNIENVNDTVFTLSGDFYIDDYVSINNLVVAGKVQGKDMIKFIDNIIYLNDTNVMISSSKIFNKSIKFNDYITVSKSLNNVDLELFYKKGISIVNSTIVDSVIIFENDVLLEKDLTVIDNLKVCTIKGINIENMMTNAVYLNRPTSIMESVTLSNVVFKSDITATSWNDTNLDRLLTLSNDETIENMLMCTNVNVENFTLTGLLNGENLTEVYGNTFMISTDQHINSKLSFLNNMKIRGNLDSRFVNNIDIQKIISLQDNGSMQGNFVFDNPVVINNNITVLQSLNNIDISQWQSNSVKTSSLTNNILTGNWVIHGNVDFKENIHGSGFINDVCIDSLSDTVQRQNKKMKTFISDETKDIKTICENIQKRKNQTDHLPQKFKSFEYFRVLKFDKIIESVHHFEFNGTDYILVNFETCQMDVYAYANEGFFLFANISEFGIIKQYLHFNYKDNLYFVTLGKIQCGRNPGNLWALENKQIKHVYDLGNVTSIHKFNETNFLVIADRQMQEWAIDDVHKNLFHPIKTQSVIKNNIKFFTRGADILLATCDFIYQFYNGTLESKELENPFKSTDITSFKVGINQKEYILLNDDLINSDHILIYNEDLLQPKELQTIYAQKPNSFTLINFEGLYESLLIFSENKREIQIYEYKGIENFKFHSSIQMKVDKLYSFQLRTRPYFAKRHCIAIVHDFQLSILEAKMYGEKLDANDQLSCIDI